jgi:recA bacterial DNA recombination protein
VAPTRVNKTAAKDVATVKKSKIDPRALLFQAFSDQSHAVESELFRSFDAEEVSGFYPNSLVACMLLGKITSTFYVVSGQEGSAKTTLMATILGQSFAEGTLIHKHYDIERAMRSGYSGSIVGRHAGVPWAELKGKKDKNGKLIEHPRYRWITETSLEDIMQEMCKFLWSLPDKVYNQELNEWFLVFDNEYKNTKYQTLHTKVRNALEKNTKLSDRRYQYYSVGDDASFQVFYAIDSLKAMTLRAHEEADGEMDFKKPAQQAAAFSNYLPYVKSALKVKHSLLFAANHMSINPMERYGDPNKETGGNAIKYHSDVRLIVKPVRVQDYFTKSKSKTGVNAEPSVLGNGMDEYTFKSARNIKNKNGLPYVHGNFRIWSSGPNFIPGIDPVYDTAHFLEMIGLGKIGSNKGKPRVVLANHEALEGYKGESIDWLDFKAEILAECGEKTGVQPSELRALCFDLVESGKAAILYQNQGGGATNQLDKSDEDGDDE